MARTHSTPQRPFRSSSQNGAHHGLDGLGGFQSAHLSVGRQPSRGAVRRRVGEPVHQQVGEHAHGHARHHRNHHAIIPRHLEGVRRGSGGG
eukprot:9479365-Pyramimonas_sp.AAC.1